MDSIHFRMPPDLNANKITSESKLLVTISALPKAQVICF